MVVVVRFSYPKLADDFLQHRLVGIGGKLFSRSGVRGALVLVLVQSNLEWERGLEKEGTDSGKASVWVSRLPENPLKKASLQRQAERTRKASLKINMMPFRRTGSCGTGVGCDNDKNTIVANDDWWEKKTTVSN